MTKTKSTTGCLECACKRCGTEHDGEMTTCEVCDRVAKCGRHPCRFEICCSCWRGIPCLGTGRVKAEQKHTTDHERRRSHEHNNQS